MLILCSEKTGLSYINFQHINVHTNFSFYVSLQRNYMYVPEALTLKIYFCSDTYNIVFWLIAEQVRLILTIFLIEIVSFLKHVRSETLEESIRSISTVWTSNSESMFLCITVILTSYSLYFIQAV